MIPPGYTLLKTAHANIARDTSEAEAWGILRYLLVTGKITASTFIDSQSEIKEKPEFWSLLSRQSWEALVTSDGIHYGLDPEDYPDGPEELERELAILSHPAMLLVRSGELKAALSEYRLDKSKLEEADIQIYSQKGGRRPAKKYLRFAQKVFILLFNAPSDDHPEFNIFLKKAMEDFTSEDRESIDEGTARDVASALYDIWVKI